MKTKKTLQILCRGIVMILALCSLHAMWACVGGGSSSEDDQENNGGGGGESINLPDGYGMSVELNGIIYYEEASVLGYLRILENGTPEELYGPEDMGFSFGTEYVLLTDDLNIRISATVLGYYPLTTQTPFELYADEVDYAIGSIYVNNIPCDIEHVIIDFEEVDTSTDYSYLKAIILLEPEGGDGEEIIYRMNTYLGFMDMDSSEE